MKNNLLKKISIILLGFTITSFMIVSKKQRPVKTVLIEPLPQNLKNNDTIVEKESFTQDSLIQLLKDLNVKYPHIVLAQSILETGHYESKIFKENNNLFGMREARVRIHTAKGTKNNHAYYDNWVESVYDYAFYQSTYYSDIRSEKQYYRKLDKSYAEAKNYVNTLKEIVERENLTEKFLE